MKLNLTSKKAIKELLNQHGLRPLKRLGQNFLISSNVVDKVIATANLKPGNIVLEVGPGIGALTIEIAKKAKQVIAVEKDKKFANILGDILKSQSINNVKIINADILKYQNTNKKYKLIANLPYNIATAVIMKFLEGKNPPQVMVVMLQKEVGQRICEKPPNMSKLAVFSQFYSRPEIVGYVSKRNFFPQPKVDSAILKITPLNDFRNKVDEKLFSKIVKAGFVHPRKQLVNNLSKDLALSRKQTEQWLSKNNVKPSQRAESLSLGNWVTLTKSFSDI